jgi:predicted transcriptional regulator of viral defense system
MTQLAIEHGRRRVFTRTEAAFWASADGAALDGLLKRAVAAGEIVRYRRGLYGLASRYARERVHPFGLALHLHGPSYISLECGLAHHGWIPEAVHTITSVTPHRSRSFETPLGFFSYTRIPQDRFFAGVRQEATADGTLFFVATPLKALADYVYVHRPVWSTLQAAAESLRIEESELETLDSEMLDELEGVYRGRSVIRFLDNVRKEVDR